MYSWDNLYLVKIYFSNKLLHFIYLFLASHPWSRGHSRLFLCLLSWVHVAPPPCSHGPTPLFTWSLPHMATPVFTEPPPPNLDRCFPRTLGGGECPDICAHPPGGIFTGVCWLWEVWRHLWAEGVPFWPHSGSRTWISRERSVLGFGGDEEEQEDTCPYKRAEGSGRAPGREARLCLGHPWGQCEGQASCWGWVGQGQGPEMVRGGAHICC